MFFLSVIIFIIIFCYNKKHPRFRRRALIYLPFCLVWSFLLELVSTAFLFSFWTLFFESLGFSVSFVFGFCLATYLIGFRFPLLVRFFLFALDFLFLVLVSVSIGFRFLSFGLGFCFHWFRVSDSWFLLLDKISSSLSLWYLLWVQPCFLNLLFFSLKNKILGFWY